MLEPKEEIFKALDALGYYCAQGYESVFSEVPAITFTIAENAPRYTLDKEITASNVVTTVDLWANDNETLSRMAREAETAMRGINYLCTWSSDVPRPESTLYHYQLRFGGVKT